jgi:hypothetical protein
VSQKRPDTISSRDQLFAHATFTAHESASSVIKSQSERPSQKLLIMATVSTRCMEFARQSELGFTCLVTNFSVKVGLILECAFICPILQNENLCRNWKRS